jgi:hypothetical protein
MDSYEEAKRMEPRLRKAVSSMIVPINSPSFDLLFYDVKRQEPVFTKAFS